MDSVVVAAFDVETELIEPGILAPELVCASYALSTGERGLLSPDEARAMFRRILREPWVLAGANLPFDVGVMLADAERRGEDDLVDLVFAKYERDEVHDTLVAQQLDAIAGGHLGQTSTGLDLTDPVTGKPAWYSLVVVHWLLTGKTDAKANDEWRLRYGILKYVPMAEWPTEARQYPVDDAVNTLEDAEIQRGAARRVRAHEWVGKDPEFCRHCREFENSLQCVERVVEGKPLRNLDGLARECRADLALHLGAIWGLRVNGPWLERLRGKVERLHEEHLTSHADFFRSGHEPGCLKRMAAAEVTPAQARALGPRRNEDGKIVAPTPHCVTSCRDGKENGPLVARRVAEAYGARVACPSCGGTGRRPGPNGNEVGCEARYTRDALPNCGGSGLVLESAPALPRSDGGGVKCDRDTLQESGDERLMSYGDDEHEKVRSTYVPYLARGVDRPLTLSPNILVSSFRTSYRGPIQQMPREGEVRTSFWARPGFYYGSCDYSGVELCTLAQCCLWFVGFSRMAQIINESGDPGALHASFGAQLAGVDVDEFKRRLKAGDKESKDYRQGSKKANFGFGGRMGAATFVRQSRKKNEGRTYSPEGPQRDEQGKRFYWGVRFCILLGGAVRCGAEKVTEWRGRACLPVCKACCVQAEILRERWLSFFPEMPKYFEWVKRVTESHCEVRLPIPGSVCGGVTGNDAANGPFQELAALLAKTALWRVTDECYRDRSSVLYGTTRIPFFVHDELFSETLEEVAHLTVPRIGTIMEESRAGIVPDVIVKVEPALSRYWLKAMEPYYENGKIRPWEDGPAGKKYLAEKGWEL